MKLLKKIFMAICALIILLCVAITVLAFNPSLSNGLAQKLYGGSVSEGDSASEEDQTDGPLSDTGINETGKELPDIESGADQSTTDQEGGDSASGQQGEIVNKLPQGFAYIQPEEDTVTAPSNVSGKNGYTPVKSDAQQVDDSQESTQADVGETGEGLTFNTEIYPYYGMLNESLQKLYCQIYANAIALKQSFSPVEEVTFNSLKTVFEAVYNDHPELFWLETEYSCKYLKDGRCVEINLQFNATADDLESAKTAFETAANRILVPVRNQNSSYEQEKAVHNALMERVEYNMASAMNQSAYSALVGGQSVCAGYARAFQYLMQQLGIPCYYCTGYSGQNHAWNIVKLDADYYNVDVTWDDTNPATYDYFNKTDADFAGTHRRSGLSVYLPACAGETYRDLETATPQIIGQEQTASASEGNSTAQTENELKKLEYYGIQEKDVIKDMDSYYKECAEYLLHGGMGTVEFQCVIPESLWDTLETAYAARAYEKGYVDDVLKELEASSCHFQIEGEMLQDGYFLLRHTVTIE